MTGEEEDRNIIITRPDTRIAVTMTRNSRTALLDRENRFLVDDALHEEKMAFQLTKPLRVGRTYNGKGVFVFVMAEVAASDRDNMELGIADYYPAPTATINSGGNWL